MLVVVLVLVIETEKGSKDSKTRTKRRMSLYEPRELQIDILEVGRATAPVKAGRHSSRPYTALWTMILSSIRLAVCGQRLRSY